MFFASSVMWVRLSSDKSFRKETAPMPSALFMRPLTIDCEYRAAHSMLRTDSAYRVLRGIHVRMRKRGSKPNKI